jgi:hypothetical protein
VGAWSDEGELRGVYAAAEVVWVAGTEGLRAIDVRSPEEPATLGALETPDEAWDVFVSEGTAYLADGPAGLLVVDVSDPAAPREVGRFNTIGDAEAVLAAGGAVYVGDLGGGLFALRFQGDS